MEIWRTCPSLLLFFASTMTTTTTTTTKSLATSPISWIVCADKFHPLLSIESCNSWPIFTSFPVSFCSRSAERGNDPLLDFSWSYHLSWSKYPTTVLLASGFLFDPAIPLFSRENKAFPSISWRLLFLPLSSFFIFIFWVSGYLASFISRARQAVGRW